MYLFINFCEQSDVAVVETQNRPNLAILWKADMLVLKLFDC